MGVDSRLYVYYNNSANCYESRFLGLTNKYKSLHHALSHISAIDAFYTTLEVVTELSTIQEIEGAREKNIRALVEEEIKLLDSFIEKSREENKAKLNSLNSSVDDWKP